MNLPRFQTLALLAAVVVTSDVAAQVINPYQAAAQREAEQAYRAGRFPELQGLAYGDTRKAMALCSNYHGNDNRICGEAADLYMKRTRDAAMAKQQAEDAEWIRSTESSLSAEELSTYKNCMAYFERGSEADYATGCANQVRQASKRQAEARIARERAEKVAQIEHVKQQKAELAKQLTPDEQEKYVSCLKKNYDISSDQDQDRLSLEQLQPCVLQAKAQAAERAAEMREVESQRRKAEAAYNACTQSPQYRLFKATEDVNTGRLFLAVSEATMASVKRLESVSGVVDPGARQAAAASLLDSQARLDMIFADYKTNGGSAGSPEEVQSMANPCQAQLDHLSGK